MRAFVDTLKKFARRRRALALLTLSAVGLFVLGYGVNGASLGPIMAAGIVFGGLVALVLVAGQGPRIRP